MLETDFPIELCIYRKPNDYQLFLILEQIDSFMTMILVFFHFLRDLPFSGIGLAQKFVRVFHLTQKPERTFWPTQYIRLYVAILTNSHVLVALKVCYVKSVKDNSFIGGNTLWFLS